MCVKSFVLAAGLLAVAGCAGNVTIPLPDLDHPANPRAAAVPPPPPPTIPVVENDPAATDGMQGMDHGSMKGMDHGSMKRMNHGSMKSTSGLKATEKKNHMDDKDMGDMESMHHEH